MDHTNPDLLVAAVRRLLEIGVRAFASVVNLRNRKMFDSLVIGDITLFLFFVVNKVIHIHIVVAVVFVAVVASTESGDHAAAAAATTRQWRQRRQPIRIT